MMEIVTVGVIGMRRKLSSKAMRLILASIQSHDSHLVMIELDEEIVLTKCIQQWPIVDVLVPIYSTFFPLQKVLTYISLRSPIVINNLSMYVYIQDRRLVRRLLARAHVPTPPAIYANRSAGDRVFQTGFNGNTLVVVTKSRNAQFQMEKPFVEKPVDSEDHSKLRTHISSISGCHILHTDYIQTDGIVFFIV